MYDGTVCDELNPVISGCFRSCFPVDKEKSHPAEDEVCKNYEIYYQYHIFKLPDRTVSI
jgi:hypothetical protein